MVECFLCGRNEKEIALFRVPIEFIFKDLHFEIIGNYQENEFICWGCVGYQYDFAKKEKNAC